MEQRVRFPVKLVLLTHQNAVLINKTFKERAKQIKIRDVDK